MALTVRARPCWELTCDGCGERHGDEDAAMHWDSAKEAMDDARACEWRIDKSGTFCEACADAHAWEAD